MNEITGVGSAQINRIHRYRRHAQVGDRYRRRGARLPNLDYSKVDRVRSTRNRRFSRPEHFQRLSIIAGTIDEGHRAGEWAEPCVPVRVRIGNGETAAVRTGLLRREGHTYE